MVATFDWAVFIYSPSSVWGSVNRDLWGLNLLFTASDSTVIPSDGTVIMVPYWEKISPNMPPSAVGSAIPPWPWFHLVHPGSTLHGVLVSLSTSMVLHPMDGTQILHCLNGQPELEYPVRIIFEQRWLLLFQVDIHAFM